MFKIGKYTVEEPNIEKLIKSYIENGSYTSGDIINDDNNHIGYEKMMVLVRKLYKMTHDVLKKVLESDENRKLLKPENLEFIESFMNDERFLPENIDDKSLIRFGSEKNFRRVQHLSAYIFHTAMPICVQPNENNNGGGSTWLEITMWAHKIDERLYLNLKAEHTIDFVNEFITRCGNSDLPRTFKFSTRYRTDQVVIYTKAEQTEKYIDILESIKADRPELFEGTEKVDQNFGKINGWIGYGEEPNTPYQSFTSIRTDCVSTFLDELKQKGVPVGEGSNVEVTPEIVELFKKCALEEGVNPERYVFNSDSTREKIIAGEGK